MKRFLGRLLCAVFLTLLACPSAPAAEPLLTIAFTGNTLGTFRPCPSCTTDQSLGGLARRATFFNELRASRPSSDQLLVLAGGHEFLPLRVRKPPRQGLGKALAEAFSLLPYDLGYVTAREDEWLEGDGAAPPKGWLTVGDTPVSRVLHKGGMRVGVVIFPALERPMSKPSPRAMDASAEACRSMRPRVDLLIAMSPWGEAAEAAFLEKYGAVADMLLGSGPALGAGARPMLDGRVLWVRAEYDGRVIPVVDILGRPAPGEPWSWLDGVTYHYAPTTLGTKVRSDPRVNNIFSWF